MKQTLILLSVLLMGTTVVSAQDDNATKGTWTTTSTPALKASEFFFDNWSKTGNSQIDATATFFGNYKYTHPKYVWDNIVDLAYGYAWQDLDDSEDMPYFETRRKSNDKIDLTSAVSWNAYKGLGASFTANLKTQFGDGYEYEGFGKDQKMKQVSDFMAPGYLTTALSFEYKKTDWSVAFSFLTGKTTFVINDSLIAAGYDYGVIRENPEVFTHAYFALGSYVKGMYLKKDILRNLDLYARLELFYDYKKPKNMAWGENMAEESKYTPVEGETFADLMEYSWLKKRMFETDIDFELKLDYRLSNHISANFALNLKYDTDFNGFGRWGHWQIYQMAGVQVFFNWKTPRG